MLLFTKIFTGSTVREVGEAAAQLGFDGLDLAVRAGQCIEPDAVSTALPAAVEEWSRLGLCVPMITLDGDCTDSNQPQVKTIFETCARCGIQFVKLGYWKWEPRQNYRQGVEQVRRALEGFQKLGQEYSVCSLVHTHSGLFYGSNASGLMQLIDGYDPRFVGAYLDPAHQALQGEPPPLALAITGEYLRMVGVKNARYASDENGAPCRSEWCALDEGLVDWPAALASLRESGYDGAFSLHAGLASSHAEGSLLQRVAYDLGLLRSWLQQQEYSGRA